MWVFRIPALKLSHASVACTLHTEPSPQISLKFTLKSAFLKKKKSPQNITDIIPGQVSQVTDSMAI